MSTVSRPCVSGKLTAKLELSRKKKVVRLVNDLDHNCSIEILLLFHHQVMSNSLWPHEVHHARLPSPSLYPRLCSNSCPLSQWCHPAISSSVTSFSCPQSFPASVLPVNIQDWSPLGLTGLISLLSKGLSRIFSSTTVLKHQFFGIHPSLWSNSQIHTWLLGKQ